MALRVDVRVDAQGHARLTAEGAAIAAMRVELAGRLDVDRLDAERDRAIELVARLADAGEDDLRRGEPGAARELDLADRSWRRPRCRALGAADAIASVEFALSA